MYYCMKGANKNVAQNIVDTNLKFSFYFLLLNKSN